MEACEVLCIGIGDSDSSKLSGLFLANPVNGGFAWTTNSSSPSAQKGEWVDADKASKLVITGDVDR